MSKPQVLSRIIPAHASPKNGITTHCESFLGLDKRPSTAYLRHLCQHYSRGCDLVVSFMSGIRVHA